MLVFFPVETIASISRRRLVGTAGLSSHRRGSAAAAATRKRFSHLVRMIGLIMVLKFIGGCLSKG